MRSKRFYVVLLLAFLALINAHYTFDLYDILQERGTCEDCLKGTKYITNDCGKVVFVDRTENYPTHKTGGNATIDYYVTYNSQVEKEPKTLKVTPAAYSDAKKYLSNGTEICFLYKDPQYRRHINTKNICMILLALLSIFLLIQTAIWIYEEFFMDEKTFYKKMKNYWD